MADYHLLGGNGGTGGAAGPGGAGSATGGSGVNANNASNNSGFGVMMMEDSGLVAPGNYGHAVSHNATPGMNSAMMSSSITATSTQNSNSMISGMTPAQQQVPGSSGMVYQQTGNMHSYPQGEMSQKLHHYSNYSGQTSNNTPSGQYATGPRLHHLGDTHMLSGSQAPQTPSQPQQPVRMMSSNQMVTYQQLGVSGGHLSQRHQQPSSSSVHMPQNASYSSQYISHQHLQPQHNMQHMTQSNEMWQNTVGHQHPRPCLPSAQGYPQHQQATPLPPGQIAANAHGHNAPSMQGPRPGTPNQTQYLSGQEFNVQHSSAQTNTLQRPIYLTSSQASQSNSHIVHSNNSVQGTSSQLSHASLSQPEQVMPSYSQGPYPASSQTIMNRPHYSASSSSNTMSHASSNQLIGQPMIGMRPMQQMNYPVSPRLSSGQQHGGTLPPGSPVRLQQQQQYHPPFSPSQPYPNTAQPSPHATSETTPPPHLSLYPNSQAVVQAPTSPQYRGPYPSQVTHSPQHLTPTPPAGSPMPPSSHTPDRLMHTSSSTPQSQGSYPSPNATHMSSPGQGPSPGNTGAPSSLQHLEQMVMPRMGTGPNNPPAGANVSGVSVGSSYYGHLSQPPTQHHQHLSPVSASSGGDNRPQPQSPAFTHMSPQQPHSHHHYLGQTSVPAVGQPSPVVGHAVGPSHVPNSQPVPSSGTGMIPRVNPTTGPERILPTQHNTGSSTYTAANSIMPQVMGPEETISVHHNINNAVSTHMQPVSNTHQYHVGKPPYQVGNTYEVQQIQQELQQLYSMHQSPENQQKIAELQEQLRYLQSQSGLNSNGTPAMPQTLANQSINQYPHSPVVYNAGNQNSYVQQGVQQHPQHYGQQMQQQIPDNSLLSSPQSHPIIQEIGACAGPPPPSMQALANPEQVGDASSMQHSQQIYPPPGIEPVVLGVPEAIEQPIDPYELNIQDEPIKKPKKRAQKGEPKKPKTPRPKKQNKSKLPASEDGTEMKSLPGDESGANFSMEVENDQENKTPKKAKPKKKKVNKDKENKESGEPKEPKPKKPKKAKTPKEPKGTKEQKDENGETKLNESGEVINDPNQDLDSKSDDTKEPKEPKPKKDGKEKKETKSKKALSSSKENKSKSTPKKKLPKIALKFSKKKRKRLGSSENSDLEVTPPPSPKEGEGVQKRRSARNTKRKKYTDDIDLNLSDETIEIDLDQSLLLSGENRGVQVVDSNFEDFMVVEKFLSFRTVQKQVEKTPQEEDSTEDTSLKQIEVEEYFVKYKNLSYIHCEWRSQEDLEKGDRRIGQKIKRFKQKRENINNFFDFLEEEPFNPDYVEVDRVLDFSEIPEIFDYTDNTVKNNSEENAPAEIVKEDKKIENEKEEEKSEIKEDEPTVETSESGENCPPNTLPSESESKSTDNFQIPADCKPVTEKVERNPDLEDTSTENTLLELPVKTEESVKQQHSEMDTSEVENVKSEIVEETDAAKNEVEEKKPVKTTRHYLVKWCGLSYEESTWELENDVDPNKIEQFYRFKTPPPKEKWKTKKKPKPSEWKKIEESHVYKGGNNLREYQLEGVNWLTFCWYNGQNCILADEMGLGKTIQSITFLNEIDKYGIPGPFLVIAPLSTIGNWQREFETWTDINAITYHGSSASRNMIQEYEMYYKNDKKERIQEVYKFQVMITTFEIVLTDCLELREIPWRCVIIDEAHRLKNRNCKLLEGLRLLNAEHSVLLTGTPLQNNVEELFSLLNFLEPNRFASNESFLEEFGDLKTEAQVDKLKALLKPMMLRRLKEDVEKSLAPKEETVIEVELTNVQKKYYRAILERNFSFLTKGGSCSNMPNLMNTMMELRKCCIHPFLINGAEEQIVTDYKLQHGEIEVALNSMVQASGKLVLIDKLLPRLKANGHRVLVFSQMVRCLDILEDYMVHKRYPYERIDGRVRGNLRQAAIDRFCKPDSDRFVFLLCTRAGGLGINLTAADTVIIFDSDWNPQNDLQAQARCHRIGQSKAVKVYRLICRNTYEREMFDKASLKLGLDKAVLQSMNSQKGDIGVSHQMSKKEIEDLLRKGAYGALMEDDNAGDKFCEEDIDQILQRRTHVIQLEEGTKGSTFAKATFSASSNRSDIEIDDPNFWEKWAKKANLDVDELKNRNELIIQEPRRRTQTRRFGTDDHMLDLSELESSDEDEESISTRTRNARRGSRNLKGKNRNRGRALDREREDELLEEIAPGNWTRAECFKVEKGLLTFGWGRWEECLALGNFRRHLSLNDVEDISRIVLLYCLLHYKGDEKIKGFIWDLITPSVDGETRIHRNHSGLSAPVPRGRKGKKLKKEIKPMNAIYEEISEWAKNEKYNPDILLTDEAYKRHLHRHSNKVLLRVRLLYYLKHEVIGDLHYQVAAGFPVSLIPLMVPPSDGEPPSSWWDEDSDKSLLIGVYKHGYERYNVMRQDPTLCFLARCGPPDGAALLAEMNVYDDELEDQASQKGLGDKEDRDVDDLEPLSPATPSSEQSTVKSLNNDEIPQVSCGIDYSELNIDTGQFHFPSVSDLNTRLRRIITAYQRSHKKQELKLAQRARKLERREKFQAAIKERELKKRELQQRRWSRREEADFYRTISSFGVEYNRAKQTFDWTRFRCIARLERKYDETLVEYFKAFYAMCKRVCGRKLTEEEEQFTLIVEPISEERASRCLQRIDLLNKIREEILSNPKLDERLKLCQPSMDLPDWWQCGKHDKDLIIGSARHGLSRMDYHLLHDPDLCFKDVLKNHPNAKSIQISSHMSTPTMCASPVTTVPSTEEKDDIYPKVESNTELLKENVVSKNEKYSEAELTKTENQIAENKEVKVEIREDDAQSADDAKTEPDDSVQADISATIDPSTEKLKDEGAVQIDEKSDEVKQEVEDLSANQKSDQGCDVSEKTGEPVIPEQKVEQPENLESDSTSKILIDNATSEEKNNVTSEEKNNLTSEEKNNRTNEEKNNLISEEKNILTSEEKNNLTSEEKNNLTSEEKNNLTSEEKNNLTSEEKNNLTVTEKKYDTDESQSKIETESELALSLSSLKTQNFLNNLDDSQDRTSQNDDQMSQESFSLELDGGEPTVAQLLAISTGNSVRWPKDKVLQIRLEHIVHAVEKNEWPVIRPSFLHNFPALNSQNISLPGAVSTSTPVATASSSPHRASPVPSVSSQGASGETTPQATPEHTPQREQSLQDVQIGPSDLGSLGTPGHAMGDAVKLHRRRRRRRRFEIEAERAKLRALLSHNMQQHHQQQLNQIQQQFLAPSVPSSLLRHKSWEGSDEKLPVLSVGATVNSASPSVTTTAITTSATATSSTGTATTGTSSSGPPPPAHQSSSAPRLTTAGTLDLRVKMSTTPTIVYNPPTAPERSPDAIGSPSTPMDLSSTSAPFSVSNVPYQQPTPNNLSTEKSNTHQSSKRSHGSTPVSNSSKSKSKVKSKLKLNSKGGSRIDALALNLQARKQQQILEEQRQQKQQHRSLSSQFYLPDHSERHLDLSDHDGHRQSNKHDDDDVHLKKRKYNEDSIRHLKNRSSSGLTPSPAHSSILSSPDIPGSTRAHSSGKHDESRSSNILDHSSLMHHDFKKWLDDHPELVAANPNLVAAAAAAMAFNPVPSFSHHTELLELPEGRRRGRRPRLDPTKLDFDKLTGEENVSVINRLTGKKITGSKAPPLKHLAEWLDKNPMFDVDPKWSSLVREKGNLPDTLQKRIITPSEKRGRRTAASLLASAHQSMVSPPTTMSFPSSSSINPLSFTNTSMLAGFPGMKFFMDPQKSTSGTTSTTSVATSASTHPLFLPFGGLAGMGLTNPLFGFPGFNFQGLQGSSSASLGNAVNISSSIKDQLDKEGEKSKSTDKSGDTSSSRGKFNLSSSAGNLGSSSNNINSATSLSSTTSLPFLYPTPGLLYNPLGLGSFALPPNLPAPFASLTQSGLVNGLGNISSTLTTTTTTTTTTSVSTSNSSLLSLTTSTLSTNAQSLPLTSLSSKVTTMPASSRATLSHGLLEGQDSDDESLKSLMGNHDDDDDDDYDLEFRKGDNFDNLDKDDSDKDSISRDKVEKGLSTALSSRSANKNLENEMSDTPTGNVTSFRHIVELQGTKSKTVSDDPTSDSTDTEGKLS